MNVQPRSRVWRCLPENLVPKVFSSAAFIAGGYAACPTLATDIDVWVQCEDLDEARTSLLAHLATNRFVYQPQDEASSFEGDGCGYEDITANIQKVALVMVPGYKPIHLLVTDAPPLMLLLNFDISTHQIALTDSGEIRSPEWTALDQEPLVVKNHDTSKTVERLARITARYAHLREAK